MLKNKRKTENIKKERKKCRENKKRKTYNTVLGFRQWFALRNQGNVPDAIVLKNRRYHRSMAKL